MSEKYEASKEDVKFDHGRADQLIRQLRDASNYLHTTDSTLRSSARDHAMIEFSGPYANLFKSNTDMGIRDGHRLGDALSDAANELQKYKELARLEQENRQKVRDWEKRNPIEQFVDWINSKNAPDINKTGPSLRTAPPGAENGQQSGGEPVAAKESSPTKDNIQVGGSGASKTSAIPDNLDVYFEKSRTLSEDFGKKLESIQNEYKGFSEASTWGQFDIVGLLKASGTWVGKNMEDASFVHVIAEAFRQAGSAGNVVSSYDSHLIQQLLAQAGVSARERKELDIPAATVAGATLSSGYVNDPVNAATGNFIEAELDVSFPGTGSGTLTLERMYNSLAVTNPDEIPSGIFGPGWSSTLDQRVEFTQGQAAWYTADGRIIYFAREGDSYARAPQEAWWLDKVIIGSDKYEHFAAAVADAHTQVSIGQMTGSVPFYWVVSNSKHLSLFFTPAGQWVGTTEGHPANTVVAVRNHQSQVVGLVHPVTERAIQVVYNDNNHAERATVSRPVAAYGYNTRGDHAGEELYVVEYAYEGEHLVSATTNAGTRSYTHTDEGLIRDVTNVNGHREVTNTYDESGRVVHQLTEHGREVSYTYARGLMTIVADADTGSNSNIWQSDHKGRLIALTAADGSKQIMRYDSWGNRVSVTGRDGSTTVRHFDDRSRITRERTPEGADYTYSWDESDRLTGISVVDARDPRNLGVPTTVMYEYSDTVNPNPSMVVDGTGAVTRFEWSERGNLLSQTDPTGVCTHFTYDQHGDLVAITNGMGDTTRLVRDEYGRVTKIIDALGHENTLTYSSSGAVTAIENPAGDRWRFTYPGSADDSIPALVRKAQHRYDGEVTCGFLPTAVTDPLGNTTRFTYNQGGDIVSVTDPLGRTSTADYDTWGNLVRYINAAGGTWEYMWDGLSQLTAVTDPEGAVTQYAYDLAGELTCVTDPTGVKTKRFVHRKDGTENFISAFGSSFTQLDVLGRVASEGKRTGRGAECTEEFVTYDAAGHPVEILDAAGGLTRIVRDEAGRPLRVVSAAGRVETYEYDAAGRAVSYAVGLDIPEQMVEPDGAACDAAEPAHWAVTRLEYDAAGQITRRIFPDGTSEKITYDSCGRVVRVVSGVRVAAYEYDKCGRLTSVQDATYGRRTYAYDAAGQITRVTDGLGNHTHFSYGANGQVSRMVDASGQVTVYEYDAADRIVRTVNGAGTPHEMVYEYGYDAAGRPVRASNGVQEYTYTYNYARGGSLNSATCDGMLIAEYGRERHDRVVWVRDYATARELDANASEGAYIEHRYVHDARGLLVERSRTGIMTAETALDDLNVAESTDQKVQALNTFATEGAYTITFGYDADGYPTTMVTPYESEKAVYNGAGQVVLRESIATGDDELTIAEYSYDVMGRLVRAQLGDMVSTWDFDGVSGLISAYSRTVSTGTVGNLNGNLMPRVEHTEVIRDAEGRIIGLDTAGSLVMYSYDAAGQLTGARQGEREFEWTFDAGLMTHERLYHQVLDSDQPGHTPQDAERILVGERTFTYNSLNQLVKSVAWESTGEGESPAQVVTTYTYDAAGRRLHEETMTGNGTQWRRNYTWGAWDYLAGVNDTVVTNGVVEGSTQVRLVTDAVGELSQVTGTDGASVPLMWHPASPAPQILGAGLAPAPGSDGGFSQLGVAGGVNPWGVPALAQGVHCAEPQSTLGLANVPGFAAGALPAAESVLPKGVTFSGAGSVSIAGLEVMGARAFDPVSKRFLSLDPLAPVPGAAWSADSYSFVGNNPVGFIDPWGTQPVSIEDYEKYMAHAGERFWGKLILNTIAVVATVAAVVVAGPVAIIALGAIAGAASAAASAMDKVGPDGGIDWKDVGKDALVGGLIGGATGFASKIFTVGRGGFLWEKGQVAQKIQNVRFLANKAPGRWASKTVDKLRAKNPALLGDKYLEHHTTRLGKVGGEMVGGFASGAIEGASDYTKNAGDDWTLQGMAASSALNAGFNGISAGAKTRLKAKITTDYKTFPVVRNLSDGGRAQRWAVSGLKHATSEGAGYAVDIPKSVAQAPLQNENLRASRDRYLREHPEADPKSRQRAQVKDKDTWGVMGDTVVSELKKPLDVKNIAKSGASVWKGARPSGNE